MSELACRVWGHRNQNMDSVWLTQLYVLFWIEVGSRRVHLAGCTYRPSGAWVAQQGRNLSSSSTTTRLGRIKASATAALQTDATPATDGRVKRRDRLGGMLHEYSALRDEVTQGEVTGHDDTSGARCAWGPA
jgi:hypothetical protein